MKSTDWFAIQRLRRGVYLISEPMHVKSNLIVGSRRTVLFDTGLGTGSIRSQVDDATAHEAGVEHHRAGPPPAWLRTYLRNVEVFHDDYVKDVMDSV